VQEFNSKAKNLFQEYSFIRIRKHTHIIILTYTAEITDQIKRENIRDMFNTYSVQRAIVFNHYCLEEGILKCSGTMGLEAMV